jgi:hypothetical protein
MEEEIFEIINKITGRIRSGCNCNFCAKIKKDTVKKIEILISQKYYPKDFVEWLLTKSNYPLIFDEINENETDKYYQLWLEKIKEEK